MMDEAASDSLISKCLATHFGYAQRGLLSKQTKTFVSS